MSGEGDAAAADASTTQQQPAVADQQQPVPPPPESDASPPVVDRGATATAAVSPTPNAVSAKEDGQEGGGAADVPFELKNLIANRAAFKRLKDEIEGDIARIDRNIAAYKKARSAVVDETAKDATAS